MKIRREPCDCWFCRNQKQYKKFGCLVAVGIAVVVFTAALVILKYVG